MIAEHDQLVDTIDREGFVLVRGLIDQAQTSAARIALQSIARNNGVLVRRGAAYAMRNVLAQVPSMREIANAVMRGCWLEQLLGSEPFVVRSLLFDKTASANWPVGWHQDCTIAVARRADVAGFGPWSVKAGVHHVKPPEAVLANMLTARLHLDDCMAENGALQVIPQSHCTGYLDSDEVNGWIAHRPRAIVEARAGDVLLMRPLLLHASRPAQSPSHRRVLHLEFAAGSLPGGLDWHRE